MILANQITEDTWGSLPELSEDLTSCVVRDVDSADRVIDYYKTSLWQHQKPLGFLNRLGIASPELIDRFHIGFSDRTLGKHLPPDNSVEGDHIRGTLRQLGLLLWSGHELMRNAITVAEYDQQGVCCQIYGRRLSKRRPVGTLREPVWYLNQPVFFNHGVMACCEQLVLCDNPLDMAILYSIGFTNVVATAGMSSFGSSHLDDLQASGVKSVVIAYGNTHAENRCALLVSQALESVDIGSSRLVLPPGLDIQRYVLKQGSNGLGALIHGATPCRQTYESLLEGLQYG